MRLSGRTLNRLAEIICGASGGLNESETWANFRYRTSSQLTEFFYNCNLDYRHDGTTRKWWVVGVLEHLNQLPASDRNLPSDALLKVIQELLDPAQYVSDLARRSAALEDLNLVLARDELQAYFDGPWRCRVRSIANGRVLAAPSRSLRQVLQDRDTGSAVEEFERALLHVESDPPAAATAACALLEAVFKVYVEKHDLVSPKKPTIKPLWKVVSGHLGFSPGQIQDDDLKRILSGMSSVVDGIAALRTHAGTAHGRGGMRYRLKPRHARLAVHSAHTLATFILESWDEKTVRASRPA